MLSTSLGRSSSAPSGACAPSSAVCAASACRRRLQRGGRMRWMAGKRAGEALQFGGWMPHSNAQQGFPSQQRQHAAGSSCRHWDAHPAESPAPPASASACALAPSARSSAALSPSTAAGPVAALLQPLPLPAAAAATGAPPAAGPAAAELPPPARGPIGWLPSFPSATARSLLVISWFCWRSTSSSARSKAFSLLSPVRCARGRKRGEGGRAARCRD
jgi:hypothetical protein